MNLSATPKVFLLFCLLLLPAGCNRIGSISSGPGGAGPATSSKDPRGDLTRAVSAMLAARSYRANMDSSTSEGTNSATVLEFVAPDSYHLTRESKFTARGNYKQETIIVGKDTWVKTGDTAWRKFPVDLGQMISQFRDPKMLDEISKSTEVKFVGPDVVDGSPALVYQYTSAMGQSMGVKATAKTWIGASDGLPRKTETEGDVNMMGKQLHTKTIITYSGFNSDIKIEVPQ